MNASFFIVVAPGLESLAQSELLEKWKKLSEIYPDIFGVTSGVPTIGIHKGGLELECPQGVGWLLNVYLKIPTRILQRLAGFTVKDFPKLFQKISHIEWPNYLRQGSFDIEVSTHGSRVKIKTKIEETVREAVAASILHQPLRKAFLKTPQTIFVRIVDDYATISIDTSGAPLYQRGYKIMSVEAPIRETLGAALFYYLKRECPVTEATTVIDPVCGSGTLLSESVLFDEPCRFREFAYQNFPVAAAHLADRRWLTVKDGNIHSVFGIDIDGHAAEAARANLTRLHSKLPALQHSIVQKDVLKVLETEKPPGENVVLMNPPYGGRLKATEEMISKLVNHAIEVFEPRALAIVIPSEIPLTKLAAPYRWHTPSIETSNGGIPVRFSLAIPIE